MSADTPDPIPSIVDHVEWLTETLTSRITPGEPVNDEAFDIMVRHLREFREAAERIDAELTIFRKLQAEAEKLRRASLHVQPETMQ